MQPSSTILLTGAAGFIGSCLAGFLNKKGFENLLLVDDFSHRAKEPNLAGKKYALRIERNNLFQWLQTTETKIDFVFHIGARTDTTEFDYAVHEKLNVAYSKNIWNYCVEKNIPLVYASSAATYGDGALGYSDDHDLPFKLKPLNPYGVSKNEFDKWALQQTAQPPFWAGLKFFNVYGPNEYHKGRMASVIWHTFNQVKNSGEMKLFRSHRPDFKDGEQLRDFIYVKDILKVCYWLMENQPASGLYNLGTGTARAFLHLAEATFSGMDREPVIRFIDMPEDIRDKYQYFTEADMHKLKAAGYREKFYTLEEGVDDYVRNYLMAGMYF
ncbi:MAG: ADP-glyceromanno-heptose 6-epimerase [Bacteroidetes bacterium]|nr:ADP-glyceromanno-heptose 6-epimerase [Bacteroidota bacterium]